MKKLRYLLTFVNGIPQRVKSLKTWIALGLLVLSLLWLWAGDSSARQLAPVTPTAADAAKNCRWDTMDYFHRAFAGQPSRLFPLRSSPFSPGSYYVFVGPAGKDGRKLPPRKIMRFGPKELKGGHNYAAVMADRGETLRWGDNSAELLQYSKPPKNEAVVLARNEADPAEWYAICLLPGGGAAAPAPPDDRRHPLHVTVSPPEHTMRSGQEVRTTARVSGGVPPYTYQWFNNDAPSKVAKSSIRWTLRKGGSHILRVVVTDSRGKTASAQSVVAVHAETPKATPSPTTPVTNPRGEWRCIRLDFAGNCIWQWVCNDLSNNCGPVPPKPTGNK